MTWDNIKVGIKYQYQNSEIFRTLVKLFGCILLGLIISSFVTIAYAESTEWWKVLLLSLFGGIMGGIGLAMLLDLFLWVFKSIKQLDSIGQEEKDKVFKALKGGGNDDNGTIFDSSDVQQMLKSIRNRQPPKRTFTSGKYPDSNKTPRF